MCLRFGKKIRLPGSSLRNRLAALSRLVADDDGLDEADLSELSRDDAMATVLDVVAAAETGAELNADHAGVRLVVGTHALDLSVVLAHDTLPGALGDEDLVERDGDDLAIPIDIVAHRGSPFGNPYSVAP